MVELQVKEVEKQEQFVAICWEPPPKLGDSMTMEEWPKKQAHWVTTPVFHAECCRSFQEFGHVHVCEIVPTRHINAAPLQYAVVTVD